MNIKLNKIHPTKNEIEFLTLSFNRFYDIYEIVMSDDFWHKDGVFRFSIIKEGFSIYAELLNYEPIQWFFEKIKTMRPSMEVEIGTELFKFFRNVITHFSFFEKWDDVYVTKGLINWNKKGQTIDKFLEKYKGIDSVKYRLWEPNKKRMTYLEINFPKAYDDDTKIYLKDILKENEGLRFSFVFMRQIIDIQVIKSPAT